MADDTVFSHFTGIMIDDEEVDPKNYTAVVGSVIVKLKPEYLETLATGYHKITFLFDDPGEVSAEFTIVTDDPYSHDTDDSDKSDNYDSDDAKDDGSKKSSDSLVPKTTPGSKSPSTGDANNVLVLAAVFALAGTVVMLFGKRRRSKF